MKKTFCLIAVLGAFLFTSQAFALIEGVGLGGVSTVAPTNAYDVSRNPALLTRGTTGMALFGALQSIPYSYLDMNSTQKDYITPKTIKAEEKNDSTYSLTVPLGCTINNGSWGAGVLISAGSDQLYKKEKHTKIIDIYNPGNTNKDTTKVEKTIINPKIEIGLGFKTGQYSSFGITFYNILTKKTETEKHNSVDIATGSTIAIFEKTSKEDKIQFGSIIGFHHTHNKVEAGCTINTGTYGFLTKENENNNTGTNIKESTSKKFTLLTSPTISIGLLYKVSSAIDFVSELQYILSSKHNENSIDDSTMKIRKEEHSTLYGSAARMGLRIHTSSSFAIMTGAGFMIEEGRVNFSSPAGETNINTRMIAGLFTVGGEYKPSDNFSLGVSITNVYYTLKYDFNTINADAKFKAKAYELQIITGFSYKI